MAPGCLQPNQIRSMFRDFTGQRGRALHRLCRENVLDRRLDDEQEFGRISAGRGYPFSPAARIHVLRHHAHWMIVVIGADGWRRRDQGHGTAIVTAKVDAKCLLSVPKSWSALIWRQNRVTSAAMVALLCFLLRLLASPFKSASRREAENAALRHQLAVLQRKLGGRIQFTNSDRLFFIQLYRWFPSILKAITIIRPETVVRWHRSGFRRY